MPRDSHGGKGYWAVVFTLCLVGVIGIFSVGMPLLLLGVTLAIAAPWRTQRAILWPAVTAVVAFVAGYVLVAPLGCSTTASATIPAESTTASSMLSDQSTTCTNVLGIDYSGAGLYNPSLVPALVAGLGLSLMAAATVGVVLRRSGPSSTETPPGHTNRG